MNLSQWLFAHLFEITGYILAILFIPRVLLEKRHPGATIAWVLIIGFVPYVGIPLYLLIGGKRIQRVSHRKDWMMSYDTVSPPSIFQKLPEESERIARLLMKSGLFPPSEANSLRIIDDGVEAYTTLFDIIGGAKESVEVATFILGPDEVGRSLVRLLSEKAREGLEVRLLLDALGSMRTSGRFTDPLREAGGKVGVFLPILPVRRRWSANLRNHRKMTIVDGNKAFVGGMNIAREYMGPSPYEGRWKDVSLLITGSGASHVRRIFYQDWVFSTEEPINPGTKCQCAFSTDRYGNGILQVVGDGPDVPDRPLYSGVLAALNRAKESIWVVTPYFVPDDALLESLALSARMGADVRLILPERSNHPLVDLAGHSYIDGLVRAGVRLYYYQPGMLHAKLITIDQKLAVVGSANMDIRSFQLNFEIASFLYDRESVEKVTQVIHSIIRQCREVAMREIERKGRLRAFSEDICRVFSPLF